MKKSFILAGALASALFFSACSSDSSSSSDKSLAERCSAGVSEDCIANSTWKMNAFYMQDTTGAYSTYMELSSPTTIVFSDSNIFSLTYSSDPKIQSDGSEILGGDENGTWSVAGSNLTLNFTFGTVLEGQTMTFVSPVTTDSTGKVRMELGGVKIHQSAFLHTNGIYEVFFGADVQ